MWSMWLGTTTGFPVSGERLTLHVWEGGRLANRPLGHFRWPNGPFR
jgi:hypothetical protein